MKKNIVMTISLIIGLAAAISAQSLKKDASPCAEIKGKTYVIFVTGKWDKTDTNGTAAAAAKIEFDAKGNGKSRLFAAYKSTDTTGPHQIQTVTCQILQSSADKALLGKTYLQFTNPDGTDAGKSFITSYDKGSKIWSEPAQSGSTMKGWMLQLPPNPPASDNIMK